MVNQQALWGGSAEMSAWEAVMWRAEGDPRTRSTGILLETLETEPSWPGFYATIERLVAAVPRLRDRVVEPSLPLVQPVWSPDPDFDVAHHVRRERVAAPDDRALMRLCEELFDEPIDRTRPPWEAVLVTGLPDAGAAFLLRVHHSMSDGTGLIQLMAIAHGEVAAAEGSSVARSSHGLAVRGLVHQVATAPRSAGKALVAAVAGTAQVARHPRAILGEKAAYAASLGRMLAPPPVGRSPLLAGPGNGALLILVDVPLDELKAAGRAAGASLNDAFVAALLGGARRYHEVHAVRRDALPVSMPVSVRTADDPLGGNKFAGVRFAGPMSEVDPARRMHLIGDVVRSMRHEPAIGFLEHVASAVTKLPDAAIVELSASIMSASDLQMSNIRGLPHRVELAGARVTGIYPLGPRPGVAAMITMITYDGTCCIGINANPHVVHDVEVFERCIREGFDEVLALARPAAQHEGTR